MALKIDVSSSPVTFFDKLFGPEHPAAQKAHALATAGVTFLVTLFDCRATLPDGATELVNTTIGTITLVSGKASPAVLHHNRQLIEQWLMLLKMPEQPEPVFTMTVQSVPAGQKIWTIKALRTALEWSLVESKNFVESLPKAITFQSQAAMATLAQALTDLGCGVTLSPAASGYQMNDVLSPTVSTAATTTTFTTDASTSTGTGPWVTIPFPAKPKPVPTVVPLREAKAIGQKVKGTSQGSVYHCVALNARVRVAARVHKTGSISIRAEWENATASELEKLQAAGLVMKHDYASLHMDAGQVPAARVIGAFMLGTGIHWSDVLMGADDLVMEP